MARRPSPTLTEVELEFMGIIWASPEATTEEIQRTLARRGRHLTGGSIRKILSILMRKRFLSRRPAGNAFVYRATVSPESARRSLVADLLKRAFGGSAGLMVAALLDSREARPKDLQEVKRAIAEREGQVEK